MDAVEDIKSRLSIEDVIGEYIQLKRAGRNFRGLSRFTNEKLLVLWSAQKNKFGMIFHRATV